MSGMKVRGKGHRGRPSQMGQWEEEREGVRGNRRNHGDDLCGREAYAEVAAAVTADPDRVPWRKR